MSLSELDLEGRLREQRQRAADLPPVPADLAQRTRARYRRLQRQRLALAAGALTIAAVFVAVPRIGTSLRGDDTRPARPPSVVHTPSLYDVPTRGSLAGDRAWLRAVAALDWTPDDTTPDGLPPDAAVAERHVVYADDVPSGRLALVLARSGRVLYAMWFTGPAGATPTAMAPAVKPFAISDGEPQGLWDRGPDGQDELVVVGQPGDSLDYLAGAAISRDGRFQEAWRPLLVANGVAVATIESRPVGYAPMGVRADGGRMVPASATDRLLADQPPMPRPADPHGFLPRLPRPQADTAVGLLAGSFGLAPDQVHPVLLWGGRNGAGSADSTVVVGATLPSGATAVAAVGYTPAGETNYLLVTAPGAPGTLLQDRTIAVPTLDGLAVTAPPSAVRAEAVEAGGVVAEFPLSAGGGAVTLSELGYADTVRVYDASGHVVGQATARPQTLG
jgi:hypothetical protein